MWEQFSTSKLRVSCVDTANRIVYMTGPTGISQQNASEQGFITGNRYMVENVADALTQPGQWFLDRSATPYGYHCAISTSQSIAESTRPSGIGNANNVISFNHVWNLLQGIMNDGGSIRIDGGNLGIQANAGTGPQAPCNGNNNQYTFYTFAAWQQTVGEDLQSVVQNPGFNNPAYPADDYSLPHGSPGAGFAVFDATQAGRSNPVLKPPAVAPTFPTQKFNPATDY